MNDLATTAADLFRLSWKIGSTVYVDAGLNIMA
jgi:hypothetical protein